MTRTTAAARRRAFDELMALPITPENPDRLTGPEVGARVRYSSRYPRYDGKCGEVTARSYVWAPDQRNGDTRGFRRYDWTVIRFDDGTSMCVDDADLAVLA